MNEAHNLSKLKIFEGSKLATEALVLIQRTVFMMEMGQSAFMGEQYPELQEAKRLLDKAQSCYEEGKRLWIRASFGLAPA